MDQPLNYFIFIAAIVIGIALFFRETLFFVIKVESHSMLPTLKEKDRILAFRIRNFEKLKRGDIVVFYHEKLLEIMIKRVIGFPGDSIDIKSDGAVFVNGQLLDEPYIEHHGGPSGAFQVPVGRYFMMGDNRAHSSDSRQWSDPFISKQFIIGRGVYQFFPFRKL